MNTIEIKSSKSKLILLFLGSVLFIIIGYFLAIKPDRFVSVIFRNSFFIRIAGITAILFSVLCLFILIRNFFTKKINLVINEDGINDNSGYTSVGMIKWEDIISIKSTNIMSNKFLIIEVKNPNAYLNTDNKFKKRILTRNIKAYNTPIAISSNTLNCNFGELEKIVKKSYNQYKNHSKN